uniref:Uncharacterized protein n=1 Tax=Trypanosoma vivax (strain Y486) TaxID=1055687 RepID=G0U9B2_TRYVY|nr:hypothetical protein TVY486_1116810 [Trypanosoma vivax Y486]
MDARAPKSCRPRMQSRVLLQYRAVRYLRTQRQAALDKVSMVRGTTFAPNCDCGCNTSCFHDIFASPPKFISSINMPFSFPLFSIYSLLILITTKHRSRLLPHVSYRYRLFLIPCWGCSVQSLG